VVEFQLPVVESLLNVIQGSVKVTRALVKDNVRWTAAKTRQLLGCLTTFDHTGLYSSQISLD